MIYRTVAILTVVFAMSAENAKAITIDSFRVGDQSCSVSHGHQNALDHANTQSTTIIGGHRDLALRWIVDRPSYLSVLTDPEDSGLCFTQGPGRAKASVTWDGADTPNELSFSLNANLTENGHHRFLLKIAEVTSAGLDLTMTLYGADAAHASACTVPLPVGTDIDVHIPYDDFSMIGSAGPADPASVGAIVLDVDGSARSGSDVMIRSITTCAPEPSTLAMAAIGALAFFGLRRRWKRA